MKRFKLSVALLSSGLMAYSPVTQASMSVAQKNAFNASVRESMSGTYGDLYRSLGPLLDSASQAQLETVQKEIGGRRLPQVQAQIIKDKNKKELIKLVISDMGQTIVMTVNPNDSESVDINGTKFALYELMNIPAALKKMAETNRQIKDVADNIQPDRSPASQKNQPFTYEQFAKLEPIERVEYFSLMRLAANAAQEVISTVDVTAKEAKKTSQFFLHPLIASQLAFAATSVKEGMSCVVAGHISTYHYDRPGHLACNPFTEATKAENAACENNRSGTMVACNALAHGYKKGGIPFCVDSAKQPNFTKYATEQCNKQSPLDEPDPKKRAKQTKAQKDEYRIKAYRRILESYAVGKGTSDSAVSACFGADNRIKDNYDCKKLFEVQQTQFFKLMSDAKGVCADAAAKTKDQPHACDELLQRDLWLNIATQGWGDVVTVDLEAEGCKKVGGTWGYDREVRQNICTCPGGAQATPGEGNTFTCPKDKPAVVVTPAPVPEPVPAKVEKKDDKCWLCIGGLILAGFLIVKNFLKKDPKPTSTTITIPLPRPTIPTITVPPSEGNNGQGGSTNNGGVRGPQPQPKPTKLEPKPTGVQ